MQNINSRQNKITRKKPAPFNPDPIWPKGYFEVLAEARVPEKERSFFAHWVRQFFNRNPGKSRRSLGVTEVQQFLAALREVEGTLSDIGNAEDILAILSQKAPINQHHHLPASSLSF